MKIQMGIILLILMLTGCGQAENMQGVELATVSIDPTATLPPTPSPDPMTINLPNTLEKDFTGTVFTINYPEGWQENFGGQSAAVFDPDPRYQDTGGPSFFAFISLSNTIAGRHNLDRDNLPEPAAPLFMEFFLSENAERGFINPDSVPEPDEAVAFSWGGLDAAIHTWQSSDGSTRGVQIVIFDENRRRFVLAGTGLPTSLWEAFEPTFLTMMGSATLDGAQLPYQEFADAYALAVAQ